MAGFNFVNRFLYGKAGQADYTPEQLPANRRALFFEMLKIHFSGLVSVNLLYVVFCLPAIVWSALNIATYAAAPEAGFDYFADGYMLVYLLILIPCMGLCGVGASGTTYVLRNWARDQHAFVWSDMKDALKDNWKRGLAVGLINGASLLIAFVSYYFYGEMAAQSMIFIVPQMLCLLLCAVWWMVNMLIFPMMVTYDMNLRTMIRNAAIIAIARLPFSVLFLALTAVVPATLALFVPYGYLVCAFYYLLVGFALTGFLYASYAIACFDRYLNPKIEGAKVNMGLREASEDEEDIDDPNPVI